MKIQKPVFIVVGITFFILGLTSEIYSYIFVAILFIIAGFIKKTKNN